MDRAYMRWFMTREWEENSEITREVDMEQDAILDSLGFGEGRDYDGDWDDMGFKDYEDYESFMDTGKLPEGYYWSGDGCRVHKTA